MKCYICRMFYVSLLGNAKQKKKSTIDIQKKKRKESEHIAMETHQFTKDGCKKVEKKNGTIKIARRQLIRCY